MFCKKTKQQIEEWWIVIWWCFEPLYGPLWDRDSMWWSHVQSKANFPPAYRRSISCSVFPEINRVRGWTKARDWKAINCFFSSAEGCDITIRSCRPQAELSSTCFYDERRGGAEGAEGALGTGLASIVALAMFHSHSFSLPGSELHPLSFHQASVSLRYSDPTLSLVLLGYSSHWYS